MEDRLHNWAAWKRKDPGADPVDAHEVDEIVWTMTPDDRAIIVAVYVSHPYQSVYYIAAEINTPPTWIKQAIERIKHEIRQHT